MAVRELHIDINKAMSICIRNGVKVSAVPVGKLFAVEVEKENSEPKRYDALVSSKGVAAAVRKTYIAWSKAILKEQENGNSTNG
ncbi:hypothetical protein OD91_0873 [Lutibacter sp. Hel_I_33_5]|uniref:hypothetical protein n=1 Tax=Lutibacter sp. Hel_I_33_5 TaxID=1566289 RepID=UPI0011A885E7|nr:hypothetical protein [Lutibacter sp. Hel_I_33_5]TVZ55618.1 hypothetical protein OD91_0873 [Lutibacter sp. Hel_I_33_5]